MTSQNVYWAAYERFQKACRQYYLSTGLNGDKAQAKATAQWNALKQGNKKVDLQLASNQAREYEIKVWNLKKESPLLKMLQKAPTFEESPDPIAARSPSPEPEPSNNNTGTDSEPTVSATPVATERERHAQQKYKAGIADADKELTFLRSKQFTSASDSIRMKELQLHKKTLADKLQAAEKARKRQQKRREKRHDEPADSSQPPRKKGRPRIEDKDGVDIKQLVMEYLETKYAPASADNKRRSERVEVADTLDGLRDALEKEFGLVMKRSTLYTRILPRNSNTIEGHDASQTDEWPMLDDNHPDYLENPNHADYDYVQGAFEEECDD